MMKTTLFLVLASTLFGYSLARASMTPAELLKKNDSPFSRLLLERFKEFPAEEVHPFVKAKPKLVKGTTAYKFRSEIRRQFEATGINFAGKYGLVAVGCGTACSQFFLVDGVSGEVIDPKLVAENGSPVFDKRSRLLFVGPAHADSVEAALKDAGGTPKAWVLEDTKLAPQDLKLQSNQ